jgi:phosphoglycerate dehydrogenase-like enzyme
MITVAIEVDPPLRLAGVVLDPSTSAERYAAFADFVRHDLPDFDGWVSALRACLAPLFPARVMPVHDQLSLQAALVDADIAIVEALAVGLDELAGAQRLCCVQKFGTLAANIDSVACAARGVAVRTLRRRTNIAVAEHAIALLLALAKRLHSIGGRVSDDRLVAGGFHPAPFDTRHTAAANWGRIGGLRTIHGATLGLLGFGEIGREVARLGVGIGLKVLVARRTPIAADEQARLGVMATSVDRVLAESDYVSVHLPGSLQDFVGAAELARMRQGAILLNTSRAAVVNRAALIAALESGHLGGAGFDVMYREPTDADDPLLNLPNLLLTPHLAGGTRLNALVDMDEMLTGLADELRSRT